MTIRRLAAVLLLAAVGGCATGYRSDSPIGGYSETQLERNVFRVTYRGNITTKQAETDDLALIRAAEVSLAHGFHYFVSSGSVPTGSAVSLATNVVGTPATTLTIACFATVPETSAVVYDADQIVATLGARYRRR